MKRLFAFVVLGLLATACAEDEAASSVTPKKSYTFFVSPPPGETSDARVKWGVNALTAEERIGRYDKVSKKRIPTSGYGSSVSLAEGEAFHIQVDEPGLVVRFSRNKEKGATEEWHVTMPLTANEVLTILPHGK